jgi:hypothetical protein
MAAAAIAGLGTTLHENEECSPSKAKHGAWKSKSRRTRRLSSSKQLETKFVTASTNIRTDGDEVRAILAGAHAKGYQRGNARGRANAYTNDKAA